MCVTVFFCTHPYNRKVVTGVGDQAGHPQNVPRCFVAYFELKLLKKQPVQEGHSDPPLRGPAELCTNTALAECG